MKLDRRRVSRNAVKAHSVWRGEKGRSPVDGCYAARLITYCQAIQIVKAKDFLRNINAKSASENVLPTAGGCNNGFNFSCFCLAIGCSSIDINRIIAIRCTGDISLGVGALLHFF